MSEHEHKHEVKIFIDQTDASFAEPDDGRGAVHARQCRAGLELFREVTGDREDPEVTNGPETIHLKEDEHFHSGTAEDVPRFT